jgi:hypothetical protein
MLVALLAGVPEPKAGKTLTPTRVQQGVIKTLEEVRIRHVASVTFHCNGTSTVHFLSCR